MCKMFLCLKFYNMKCNFKKWRICIDSSQKGLNGDLLHNRNKYPSIPVNHSFVLKETHGKLKFLLQNQ